MPGHFPGADPSRNSESFRCDLKRFPEAGQFRQAESNIHDAKSGDRAANKVIQEKTAKGQGVNEEDVVFPKLGPRHENEEEADLKAEENEGDCQKAIHRYKNSHKKSTKLTKGFCASLWLILLPH